MISESGYIFFYWTEWVHGQVALALALGEWVHGQVGGALQAREGGAGGARRDREVSLCQISFLQMEPLGWSGMYHNPNKTP